MPVKLLPFVTCYSCNYFIFTVVSGFSSIDILNTELFYTLAAHAQLPAQAQSDRDLLGCLTSEWSLHLYQHWLLPHRHQSCTALHLANCNLPEPL